MIKKIIGFFLKVYLFIFWWEISEVGNIRFLPRLKGVVVSP